MALPNKKKELLLQNLNSIMSEVRAKSLLQLKDFPGMPPEEKIALATKALNDPEETVRATAQSVLEQLGGSAGAAPPPPPLVAEEVQPSLPALEEPAQPPPAEATPEPPPAEEANPAPETPQDPPADATEEFSLQPPPLDEEFDPALPNLEALRTIPQKLDHVRYLTKERPGGHLTQLLQLAGDQIEEIALTALQALLKMKDPRISQQVLPYLAIPNFSSQRRFLILKIIMETKTDLEISHLDYILQNEKDVIVKSGLVKVFARCAGENGVATLRLCLFDPDPRVRANTVEVIEEQGIRGCDSEIAKLLNDPENRVKVNTAKYLVKQGHGQAFNTLKTMLGSSEVWLRDSVIFALGEIGDQSSLTLLKAALKDPNQGIRLSVLKALAKINNASSREALQGAEKDSDAVVAQVARGLFEKIKDTPLSPPKTIAPAAPAPVGVPAPKPAVPPASAAPLPKPALPVTPPRPTPAPQASAPQASAPKPVAPSPAAPPAQPPDMGEAMQLPEIDVSGAPQPGAAPVAPVAPPKPTAPQPVAPRPAAPIAPPPIAKPPVPRPAIPTAPAPRPVTPVAPAAASQPPAPKPAAPKPAAPKPPAPVARPAAPASLPAGSPQFQKPRSAEVYQKLCSDSPEMIQAGMKDLPFIAGDDQMILLVKAATLADDGSRLAAAKLLSRKRGPAAVELMQQLAADPSEIVHTFAQKALTLMK